ncbi:hypothetical protein BQ8420_26960 [Nocardiopsis sp. JB363]|nr:hypothetical protein BQ8420_26960 [Nocardiopsis sp. JB363]
MQRLGRGRHVKPPVDQFVPPSVVRRVLQVVHGEPSFGCFRPDTHRFVGRENPVFQDREETPSPFQV